MTTEEAAPETEDSTVWSAFQRASEGRELMRSVPMEAGTWHVKLGEDEYASDELTLEEVEAIEKLSGVPWNELNPTASTTVARGMLAVFAMRDGKTNSQVKAWVNKLTYKEMKAAFRWEPSPELQKFIDDTKAAKGAAVSDEPSGNDLAGEEDLAPLELEGSQPSGTPTEPESTTGRQPSLVHSV